MRMFPFEIEKSTVSSTYIVLGQKYAFSVQFSSGLKYIEFMHIRVVRLLHSDKMTNQRVFGLLPKERHISFIKIWEVRL